MILLTVSPSWLGWGGLAPLSLRLQTELAAPLPVDQAPAALCCVRRAGPVQRWPLEVAPRWLRNDRRPRPGTRPAAHRPACVASGGGFRWFSVGLRWPRGFAARDRSRQ